MAGGVWLEQLVQTMNVLRLEIRWDSPVAVKSGGWLSEVGARSISVSVVCI